MHNVESNGARIPALGLGTWELRGDQCARIVEAGLKAGYRHVDTAQGYGNETQVGEGIRASGVAREDIFLTTKIWHDNLKAGPFRAAAEESVAALGTGYVDLLLIHWPNPAVPIAETMGAMAEVRAAGLARHIGISNFTVAQIDEAVAASEAPIVTNQIEYHPYLDQTKVREACARHGISVTAYCPIARGKVVGDPVIDPIAGRHGKSAAQVTLRWLVQQPDVIAIPRTSSPARLAENLDIDDFALSEEDMAAISGLARPDGRLVNVAWAPDWD
ncbi:aldo/keto reductase [Microbaculum marinum]|uniref:Aldo/keto reductase n=1 Tax=Microbaculum marinum TaxID=1764581 RepID=A0AAW9S0L4_9HYPH